MALMGRTMSVVGCPYPGCPNKLARISKNGTCQRHNKYRRCIVADCPGWVTANSKNGVCRDCAVVLKLGKHDFESHRRGWEARRRKREAALESP